MRQSSGKQRQPSGSVAFCQDVMQAAISQSLGELFPLGVLAAESREPGCPLLLLPAEAQFLGSAVRKRAQEFAAGRVCARRLLAEFGISNFPIAVAADRQPVWPAGMVGSITHTTGFCAAVVAEKKRVIALGIDSEVAAGVEAKLWPAICTTDELQWLHSLPESERGNAVTLIFSAKEAFYKCQYPLVGERLKFRDLSVEPHAWGDQCGAFSVQPNRRIAFAAHAALPVPGRFLFHEEFVTTGIALEVPVDPFQ
jgi:4'-phosphopantetheinyl transferase EntD